MSPPEFHRHRSSTRLSAAQTVDVAARARLSVLFASSAPLLIAVLAALFSLANPAAAQAPVATPVTAATAVVKTDQARAELLAHAPGGVSAGQTLWLGLKIEHLPHWHTYWRNPGDSGLPTQLQFELPSGFVAGEIAWPTPKVLPVGPLVNYGYEGNLLLAVPVSVPANWRGEQLSVKLRADWLICKDVCIPEGGDFAVLVPSRAATAANVALFEQAASRVPQALAGVKAQAEITPAGLKLRVEGLPAAWQGQPLSFFPELAGVIDNAAQSGARWAGGEWHATVPLSTQRSESPTAMEAVLAAPGAAAGLRLPITLSGTWPPAAAVAAPTAGPVAVGGAAVSAASITPASWSGALLLALLGGLLLNLMPCVFPVLSLKVLGFAQRPAGSGGLVAGGWAYSAGVVLSFVALGALMLALRAAGEHVGWGFQLQSPLFVAALAALFSLIALNLMGVFEFRLLLPQSWATAQARSPVLDHALTGVLAAAIASPCTAPFMGAALGLTASLPVGQAFAIFAALGMGMALPYLALSAWPGLARRLPRPGAWMDHFKTLMAFPMWATVVWLVWVLAQQVGIDGVAAGLGSLLALALLAWTVGVKGLSERARWVWRSASALVFALTLAWAWPSLHGPETPSATERATARSTGEWQAWSSERVRTALEQGQPVFVDFTAAWCVTCQFNKRTVLSQPSVQSLFAAKRVLLLRADWTRRDAAITAALSSMGRQGVPVYALHIPGAPAPSVLSEILSERDIREALRSLP